MPTTYQDKLITEFTDPAFQQAFRLYFEELGLHIKDWDGLFHEIDTDDRGNRAYVRLDGDRIVGFLMFCPVEMSSWFFTQPMGFVREFWIAPAYRGQGHGGQLLALAESWFAGQGIRSVMLTTHTAPGFYERRGYRLEPGCQAKNQDPVYRKEIGTGEGR